MCLGSPVSSDQGALAVRPRRIHPEILGVSAAGYFSAADMLVTLRSPRNIAITSLVRSVKLVRRDGAQADPGHEQNKHRGGWNKQRSI